MERIQLAKLVKITSGFAFKSSLFNTDGDGLPLIRIRDVIRGYSNTYYNGEYKADYLIKNGDALIGMDGEFNLALWEGDEALLNQRVCKIASIDERLDQNYLIRFLPKVLKDIEDKTPFVTVKHLSVKDINNILIPLPPLEEQRRIASILDKADELRQKRKQAIVKLDQLLQATFIDMFGDPSNNPNNYNQYELDTLILIGPQNGLYKPATMYGEGIPIVRIDGFKSGDIIDNKGFKRLSLEQSDIEKYQLNKFDLVINRVNSPEYIGKTALVRNLEEPTVFESNMMRFSVDTKKLNPYFLLFFLKQQFVLNQIANKRKDAVNQSSINQQDVKSLVINIPPIEKQLLFANFFEKVEINKHLFYKQYVNFNNLFKSLQNKAFSGNL